MKFGKYMFENYKEFQAVRNLAVANGFVTFGEFENFLKNNYNNFNIKKAD